MTALAGGGGHQVLPPATRSLLHLRFSCLPLAKRQEGDTAVPWDDGQPLALPLVEGSCSSSVTCPFGAPRSPLRNASHLL